MIKTCPTCGGLFVTPDDPNRMIAGRICSCGFSEAVNLSVSSLLDQLTKEKLRADQAETNVQIADDFLEKAKQECDNLQTQLTQAQQQIETLRECLRFVKCNCNFDQGHEPHCAIVECHDALSTTPTQQWVRKEDADVIKEALKVAMRYIPDKLGYKNDLFICKQALSLPQQKEEKSNG